MTVTSYLLTKRESGGNRESLTGFSLVEIVIASTLLIISATAIASIFTRTIFNSQQSAEREAITSAINKDIAEIERLNINYACPAGTCGAQAAQLPKFQYGPEEYGPAYDTFKLLCSNVDGGLASGIIQSINRLPLPEYSLGGKISRIKRTVASYPGNTSEGTHLYIVEWEPSVGPTRQVILSPTVASWCP